MLPGAAARGLCEEAGRQGGREGTAGGLHCSLKAFGSVGRSAAGALPAGWRIAQQAGPRVEKGRQGLSSLGNNRSLFLFE